MSNLVIPNFINEQTTSDELLTSYNKIYNETSIVTIPKFISTTVLKEIQHEIENYKWWTYAIIPNNNEWKVKYDNNINQQNINECDYQLENKKFSYRFKRSINDHFETCPCISCKLRDTISSLEATDIICKIVGCKNITPNEIFLSNYGKDDFLSLHHDIKKGDIAVTFSLTYDWHPTYGGILHFCDESHNIYKSVVPTLGSLNIFKLDPNNGLDHFVSTVNVNKNRYTLTAWYNVV